MMSLFYTSLEQALILLPLVLGMYFSYRILNVTDLTVDGTYVLGAAIFARSISLGLVPALLLSIIAGALVGKVVSYMQRGNVVSSLVVGVLASFMLYSVNLQILGRPNICMLGKPTILSILGLKSWIIPLGIIGILLFLVLFFILSSSLGLKLRAFGHNQKLLAILGKSPERYRLFGLALSNSLAALTGALSAQINGFADINMGLGVALISIGAVVIGGHIIRTSAGNFSACRELASCFIGILVYFICLNLLLRAGIEPANLKFVLGAVLFFTLRNIHRKGSA